MQALLSFEQAPPIAAPFRFFLTAPLFSALAALLLAWSGPEALVSRWSPQALALTHLLTLGFILQVMVGAMIQLLPVVAGANLPRPLPLARGVHLALQFGTLSLAAAFLGAGAFAYALAATLLVGGLGVFAVVAGGALARVPSTSPTITGFKLVLPGLLGVLGVGAFLALIRGGLVGAPDGFAPLSWVGIHVGWGLGAWGLGLLSAVSYVVVPMFQLTPNYPSWFARLFGPCLLGAMLLASLSELAAWSWLVDLCAVSVVWLASAYCGMTLWLQQRSKRARQDVTQRFWRAAMLFSLAGCGLWAAAHLFPDMDAWPQWPMLFAVLVLQGGFMSVIVGMLYKIIPFLVWLHLQNRGQGRVTAPNMKQVLADAPMHRQRQAHLLSCTLMLAAVLWPKLFVYPAALALLAASLLLAHNLWLALGVYRRSAMAIDARLAAG